MKYTTSAALIYVSLHKLPFKLREGEKNFRVIEKIEKPEESRISSRSSKKMGSTRRQ